MSIHTWTRPAMPPAQNDLALPLGASLVALGVICATFSTISDVGFVGVAVGSGAASLGLTMVFVGMILREIRQAAFEAALRAGEVGIR